MPNALSIVVVSFNSEALLERCLGSLQAQAKACGAELLVVRATEAADVRSRFAECRWVEAPPQETVPRMRALGIAASSGSVVALLEDDCVADPGWCEAVLEAHRGPWVAVGGPVEPGPYAQARDWAVFLYEYGRFMLPFVEHPTAVLPGNNVAYKRAALGTTGPEGFEEVFVHQQLAAAGQPMCVTPGAVVQNVNSWPLAHLLRAPFHHGRVFGARRAQAQSAPRRLAQLVATPLVPWLQAARLAGQASRRPGTLAHAGRALPFIVLFGSSWAIGEAVGSLLGEGTSAQRWR